MDEKTEKMIETLTDDNGKIIVEMDWTYLVEFESEGSGS
jgi:hypothetical protein